MPAATIAVPNHAILGVEQHDAELLVHRPPNTGMQERGRLPRRPATADDRRADARQRPSAKLDGREHLRGFRAADARGTAQIVDGRSQQAVESAACGQQLVRDGECVAIATAAAEHERDQFVVAERRARRASAASLGRSAGVRSFIVLQQSYTYGPCRRVGRCAVVSVAILVSSLIAGCGDDPPNKEIQQAQQAIDEARAAGADRYSSEEFNAAQDARQARAGGCRRARLPPGAQRRARRARSRAERVEGRRREESQSQSRCRSRRFTTSRWPSWTRAPGSGPPKPPAGSVPRARPAPPRHCGRRNARARSAHSVRQRRLSVGIPPLNASMQRLTESVRDETRR